MLVNAVPFTASAEVGTAAHNATNSFGAVIAVPAQGEQVVGMSYTGFTAVVLHDGVDNTGDVVAVGGAAGVYGWNYEINCPKGLYVEVTGTGKGTVWLV